jgi:hypothetical protein
MAKPRPPIERVGASYRINLDEEERELIGRLMGELRQLLAEPAGDDRLRRLFPAAYHSDADRDKEDEYQRLMREELLTSRLTGLDTVEAFFDTTDPDWDELLTEAQMTAFLQALNGVRLVLGTILDISEDHDVDDVDDDDPLVGEFHLYNFLSWVLDWTIRALQA